MKKLLRLLCVTVLFVTSITISGDIQPTNAQEKIVVSPYDATRDRDEFINLFKQERRWLSFLAEPKQMLERLHNATMNNTTKWEEIAIATCDNRFAGFIVYSAMGGHISNCAVKPEFRSKGCCPKLLNYVCDEVKKAGIKKQVWLETAGNNYRAQRAYFNAGFTNRDIEEGKEVRGQTYFEKKL